MISFFSCFCRKVKFVVKNSLLFRDSTLLHWPAAIASCNVCLIEVEIADKTMTKLHESFSASDQVKYFRVFPFSARYNWSSV